VSTSTVDSGLPLAGIAQRSHGVVVDRGARRRDDEHTGTLLEGLRRDRLDADSRPVGVDLYLSGLQTQPLTQRFRDDQASCLVNGCSHGCRITIESGALRPPGIPPAEFGLRDEHGKLVRLRDMRGRPTVVTFLYTTCRDSCPLTTQQIRQALDDLGHDVPVIAVSVDPKNDTPRRARAFEREQGLAGRMRWVLGTSAQLRRIWRDYGVAPQNAESEHSASTVLLDATGRQRIGFATSVLTPDGLAHDIAALERRR